MLPQLLFKGAIEKMLKVLVSLILGPWGLKVLDFYLKNNAIINSIIFIYGIFLAASHWNFRKICDGIYDQISELSENFPKKRVIQIDIKSAIEERKIFPFVAGQISLFPKRTTPEAIMKFMEKEKRWKEQVGARQIRWKNNKE